MDDWLAEPGSDYEEEERERERQARRRAHFTSGFREALDAGWEETAQSGFNEGFVVGLQAGIRVGEAQGCLSAIEAFISDSGNDDASALCREAREVREALSSLRAPSSAGEGEREESDPVEEGSDHFALLERARGLGERAGARPSR